ncbi:MAG: peptidoglycan-binding protein [Candidatus Paceibacterota bacterium]
MTKISSIFLTILLIVPVTVNADVFTKDFHIGMEDPQVLELQKYLNSHGYVISVVGEGSPGNETMYYGNKTASAVARFQETYRNEILLPNDLVRGNGLFYPSTRAVLNRLVTKDTVNTTSIAINNGYSVNNGSFNTNFYIGMEHPDVVRLQRYLNSNGFIVAPYGDGSLGNETTYYGAKTAAAVARFQEAHKSEILVPNDLVRGNGLFYPSTRAVLNRILANGSSVGTIGGTNKVSNKKLPADTGNMKLGDTGYVVFTVQKYLWENGYLKDFKAGYFDKNTDEALKDYLYKTTEDSKLALNKDKEEDNSSSNTKDSDSSVNNNESEKVLTDIVPTPVITTDNSSSNNTESQDTSNINDTSNNNQSTEVDNSANDNNATETTNDSNTSSSGSDTENNITTVTPTPYTPSNPSSFMPELKVGEAKKLPPFKVVGPAAGLALHDFAVNGPGVRDYSMKFPYSLKNGVAYYAGGNHGVPHKYDDVWSYNVVTNTWTMESAPTPGVYTLHTYWCLDYDDSKDRLIQFARIDDATGKWPLLQDPDPDIYLIQWTKAKKKWEAFPLQAGSDKLQNGYGCATVLMPTLNKLITYAGTWEGTGMQAVDLTTGKVDTVIDSGKIYFDYQDIAPRVHMGMEYVGNGQIISWENFNKFTYDFKTNLWSKEANFWPAETQVNWTGATYDPVNGLIFFLSRGKFWTYDPITNKVQVLNVPNMPSDMYTEYMMYYDIKNNVLVIYEDKSNQMYVYRHGDGTVKRQPVSVSLPSN